LSSAYQQAQLSMDIFNPKTVSVGDLFIGALIPGLVLVAMYILYLLLVARMNPEAAPCRSDEPIDTFEVLRGLLPPLGLITIVLGSILAGAATPTEAAGIGAIGALLLALAKGHMNFPRLQEAMQNTLGGVMAATLVVMVVIFLLGFILDFIEITYVVVPIVGPILLTMGVDPIWLGIMIALNLQTSFLTPPFGFALFYLRGVAPDSVPTSAIYRGVVPFIILQLLLMVALWCWPTMATWLPSVLK